MVSVLLVQVWELLDFGTTNTLFNKLWPKDLERKRKRKRKKEEGKKKAK